MTTRSTRPTPLYIRPLRVDDSAERAAAERICLLTGAGGTDATALTDHPRLFADIYLNPYLVFSPEYAFGLVNEADGLVGYVVAVSDSLAFERTLETEWWPALRRDLPLGSAPAGSLDAALIDRVHHPELTDPQVAAQYPAHLHINLLPAAHGAGKGRRLLTTALDALRADGIPGVFLGVDPANHHARGFYEHIGFAPIAGADLLGYDLRPEDPRART